MNEEEKKARAFLRFYVSDDGDEYFNKDYCIDKNIIETILHLIEKQQKEIEQMKEDYQILKDDIEEHRIAYVDTPEFEEKYISKDKIKEKIEELKNRKIGASTGIFAVQVDILEELLGE